MTARKTLVRGAVCVVTLVPVGHHPLEISCEPCVGRHDRHVGAPMRALDEDELSHGVALSDVH